MSDISSSPYTFPRAQKNPRGDFPPRGFQRVQLGGEGGIRTLGESPHAGFQDRYHQPLGHLSKIVSLGILTD